MSAPRVLGSNTQCAVAVVGPCAILLWRRAIVMQGANWIGKAISELLQENQSAKIGFLTILEKDCELSTPTEVRHKLAELLTEHQDQLAGAAITFEGQGFRMTLVRSIITAINMASRSRFPNSVFSDAHTAADWLDRRQALGPNLSAIQLMHAVASLRTL